MERTVTVMRSPEELYARWRDLTRLPELMGQLESVTPVGDGRSRWTARGPGDIPLSWEAEIVADEPGRLIAWRSVEGAGVDNAGSVRFTPAPGGRGTEVKVLLSYAPPAGRLGTAVATMLGRSGDQEVREDLRRFKQRMEADEVATAARRHSAPAASGCWWPASSRARAPASRSPRGMRPRWPGPVRTWRVTARRCSRCRAT